MLMVMAMKRRLRVADDKNDGAEWNLHSITIRLKSDKERERERERWGEELTNR
jgi:hypothetical protein